MGSKAIEIAEAIKDELNATAFSLPFTAVRDYLPRYRLEDMTELKVTIVPKSMTSSVLSRKHDQDDYLVDIAVQKKLEDEDNAKTDPYASLVDEIRDHFRNIDFPSIPAVWFGVANEPIYAVEHLDQFRQFTSIITLSYRAMYDPYSMPPKADFELWFDSSDVSTVTDDPISQWDTKVGSNNASQSIIDSRPDYVLAYQNNKNVVQYDGTDDYLLIGDIAGLEVDDFTAFFAIKRPFPSTHYGTVLAIQANMVCGDYSGIRFTFPSPTLCRVVFSIDDDTEKNVDSTVIYDGNWHVFTIRKSGTNVIIRRDKIEIANISDAPATINYNTEGLSSMGATKAGGSFIGFIPYLIGELLFYTEARSNVIIESIESSLISRWL